MIKAFMVGGHITMYCSICVLFVLYSKFAYLEYQEAVEECDRVTRAKILRTTVASANREHWKTKVENTKSSRDAYKLMKWATPRRVKITSPLRHEERFIADQAERATVLRDRLLARFIASDNLPPCTISGEARISCSEDLSELKVRHCTIGSGNTSPGADGISVKLLSACWENIGSRITRLFRACIQLGYYPSCFKLAEIVFLPKPKREPSTIKRWRPIALLSCLGKGLERILAKRMSHLAITSDIVVRQQFGALSKHSATDPVSCVVHDIEKAKTLGWASTPITLDVEGAFDAVLHNRLIWRMRAQGWPKSILRWTKSFLGNRIVQVRFQGGIIDPNELLCGVPQGSPISPLLFLLYMAEPMRSGNALARFSHTDDIGILGIGRTVRESASIVQREVDSIIKWANENAISFDAKKSELIQFPGHKKEEPIGIKINRDMIVPEENIRWLGVHLDSRLLFKHHVTTWSARALSFAQHLRRLTSVQRGAAPKALITAIDACIVPVATFGAEEWWPGLSRPKSSGTVTPPTSFHCELIDKVLHMALRAGLPVWRTTPNVVLHREGGIAPARIILEGNRLRLAARINTLDDQHPLRIRESVCPNVGTLKYKLKLRLSKRPENQISRVQRALCQQPQNEAAEPLPAPVYVENLGTKVDGIANYQNLMSSISVADICAYSDGSSEGPERLSWGYVLQRGGITFKKGHGTLHGREVHDAEIFGATMTLRAALSKRQNEEKILVLLDNQSAVMALQTGKSASSIKLCKLFHDLAKSVNAEFRWVPGHSKIGGNEDADLEARTALRDLAERNTEPNYTTLAYLRRLMQQRRQELVEKW